MAPNACMLRLAPTLKITHRYLWAWDTMLESFTGYKEQNQVRAVAAGAPEDAVYFDGNRYVTLAEWEAEASEDARFRLKRAVEAIVDGGDGAS
jgi:hypothetical protein